MSVVQVRYVRKALEHRFTGLISTDDLPRQLQDDKRHDAFLSRGLAALAVQMEHKRENVEAALAVFDGQDDRGLDAIAVEPRAEHPRITLVQAKWSHRGKAKFDESDAHKLLYGLQLIIDQSYTLFNQRFQPHVPLVEKVFDSRSPRINLVLALLRTEPINSDVRKILSDGIKVYNDVDRNMVDIKVLDLRDFHRETLGDAAAPKINTRVRLEGFGMEDMPYKAMYGIMTAPDVATLYGENRRGLFARNIRDALDLSDVNQKIRNTLLERPQDFWYFSNGITMLCDTVEPVGVPVRGGVGEFEVTGLSVVNGAQTVSAIHTAYELDPEKTAPGRVLVRLISLSKCPPGFGEEVTTTTNTQNPIEERDFKALDPAQAKLRDEFTLALRKTYVIKRGEQAPTPEHGCTITEAAEALAAVHQNAVLAARAKQDRDKLWGDDTYLELFGTAPNVFRVWRSVELLRTVRNQLSRLRDGLVGRAAAAATYGDLLITHAVYRQLDTQAIEDPDTNWEAQLARVPALVHDALGWALSAIDREFGPTSHVYAAVHNTERIQRVARAAVRGMTAGMAAPELAPQYQAAEEPEPSGRQVGAVKTIVAAKRIPDGTVLEFRPVSRPERREMAEWLAEDPNRSLAVWRNSAKDQLQWQADHQWYSPSGLVRKMRQLASGKNQAAQGTKHWHVPDEGPLVEIAAKLRLDQDLEVGEQPADQA